MPEIVKLPFDVPKDAKVEQVSHPINEAWRVTFPNGYTASVVRGEYTYGGRNGLFELAVVWNDELVYDTPITNDVIGWLNLGDLYATLEKVKALPPR